MQYDEPTKIMPFVWLGNSQTAHDKKKLVDMGVTHILNTAVEADNAFPDLFIYCKIALTDSKDQEFEGVFEHAFKFIERCKESGGRILIHCSAGVSRAATVAIGYIVSGGASAGAERSERCHRRERCQRRQRSDRRHRSERPKVLPTNPPFAPSLRSRR